MYWLPIWMNTVSWSGCALSMRASTWYEPTSASLSKLTGSCLSMSMMAWPLTVYSTSAVTPGVTLLGFSRHPLASGA